MLSKLLVGLLLSGAFGLCYFVMALKANQPKGVSKAESETSAHRVTVEIARDRATLTHDLVADTLDVIHHHYFRREASVLPARALNDVFAKVEKRSDVKVKWLAVNAPAMNIDHEPKSKFEKAAAKELAAGKAEYSRVEDSYYLRAAPIPLGAGCVRCHTKFTTEAVKTPLLAGLVVAIPLKND